MRRHGYDKAKGFSTFDTLLGVLILSFGLIGFIALFSQLNRQSAHDELTLVATNLASEKLEQSMAVKANSGYSAVTNGTTTESIPYASHTYSRQTVINWVEATDLNTVSASETGYKKIKVTVSWSAGTAQSLKLSSHLTNY